MVEMALSGGVPGGRWMVALVLVGLVGGFLVGGAEPPTPRKMTGVEMFALALLNNASMIPPKLEPRSVGSSKEDVRTAVCRMYGTDPKSVMKKLILAIPELQVLGEAYVDRNTQKCCAKLGVAGCEQVDRTARKEYDGSLDHRKTEPKSDKSSQAKIKTTLSLHLTFLVLTGFFKVLV